MTVAYLGGIQARSEAYMRTHWDHAKGFVDDAALSAAQRTEEALHVQIQLRAPLDFVAPALAAWEDLLRPLAWGPGVAAGQLARTFETNTFHRQPEFTGDVGGHDAAAWFRAFQLPGGTPWVLTLPSPWDAVLRGRDAAGTQRRDRILQVGQALNAVARTGVRLGAAVVRFHDASILYPRAAARDVAAFADGLEVAGRGLGQTATLHLTNGDAFAHPDVLEANPLRGLSIEDPGTPPPRLRLPNGTRLSAAVLRGEESLVEAPQVLAQAATGLAGKLGLALWGITNGWDLDHVPHAIAARKASALAKAKALVQEVLA